MIANFNEREEDEKDENKTMFPSVSVWVRYEEPGNYTHLISLPRNCSLLTQFDTSFIIWRSGTWHFILLVVSTVNILVQLAARPANIFSQVHSPHHTWSACVIAYLNHIHCPHLTIVV